MGSPSLPAKSPDFHHHQTVMMLPSPSACAVSGAHVGSRKILLSLSAGEVSVELIGELDFPPQPRSNEKKPLPQLSCQQRLNGEPDFCPHPAVMRWYSTSLLEGWQKKSRFKRDLESHNKKPKVSNFQLKIIYYIKNQKDLKQNGANTEMTKML